MTQIAEFIRDSVLRPRLMRHGCLLVYDPDRRYRELCLDLASERCTVVDASESSLESRAAALQALRRLGQHQAPIDGLVVYVPAARPATHEQMQLDPFSVYAAAGGVFPDGDADGYQSLCLLAKPDQATAVRRVFEQDPAPSFATIDAIGGGTGWPQLKALLGADSARNILLALMAPHESQKGALNTGDAWIAEAKDLLRNALGMELKTKSRKWSPVAEELWRFVLFSEFVFDLPGELPAALAGVPRAVSAARPLVEDLCDQLRNDLRNRTHYVAKAEEVEAELTLPAVCADIADLGRRDTFPFEERTFLQQAIAALQRGDVEAARGIAEGHARSVWRSKAESQGQWAFLQAALDLVERCGDFERQLGDHSKSLAELVDFYAGSLREADRLHRELEQAIPDFLDPHDLMAGVIEQGRDRYRKLSESVQALFLRHLEATGWPLPGRLANAQVFDRFLAPRLEQSGRRVAYLMVDALRYELGVELEKQLTEDGPVELHAACAQLPTITTVGMASLLPGATAGLQLTMQGETLAPKLEQTPARYVAERMDVFRRRYGDRFAEMTIVDFLKCRPQDMRDTVDLLVLRSYEIDSMLENDPLSTLRLIPGMLKNIRAALHKLRTLGFREAVIATDHGFFLNAHAGAGDVCAKPNGNWAYTKDRSMLGQGSGDAHNLVLPAAKVGIRGDFTDYACPRSLAPYQAGVLYFHSGASLPETVVPVLVARLEHAKAEEHRVVRVALGYKQGAKKITARLPVFEIGVESDDMFSQGSDVEISLEAHDAKGNVVGEAKPGGPVNPATGTITLKPGQRVAVTLRMQTEFEGKFAVKAINPKTLASYASLNLETDYAV